MSFGEFIGSGAATTKLLLHLNGSSADSSGNSNNGTDTNMTYSKAYGKFNEGAYFNAPIGSKIQCTVTGTSTFTIRLWFYNVNTIANGPYIWIRRNAANNSSVGLQTITSGGLRLISYNGATVPYFDSPTGVITQNTWYHIVAVVNGTSSMLIVNGKVVSSGTLHNITYGNDTYIGSNATVSGSFINAYMDDVVIENKIWTLQDAQKDFTNSLGRF